MLSSLAGAGTPNAQQAEPPPLAYQVEAAFLMNFTKFVTWPQQAFADGTAPISLCVFGDDVFGPTLDQIVAGETADGRKLTVQRLRDLPAPQCCQLVFVSGTEKEREKILSGLGPNILTVGEGKHFLIEGGMIAFVIENRRVRFDINEAAAERSGIRMSSKLLQVARTVRR